MSVRADWLGDGAIAAEVVGVDVYERMAGEVSALANLSAEPNVFAMPEVVRAAAMATGSTPVVAIARRGTLLIGCWPLVAARPAWGGARQLSARLHDYAVVSTPLLHPDHAIDAMAALLDALAACRDLPGLLSIPFLWNDGPAAQALSAATARTGRRVAVFERYTRAKLAPGRAGARFLSDRLDGPGGRTLRKERRRLSEAGAVFTRHAGAQGTAAFETFLALELGGWKGIAGTAVACDEANARFLRAVVAAPGRAEVHTLRIADKTIAAGLVLRAGGMAWFLKIAFDETEARLSPGIHLALEVTGSLLDEPGFRGADSCIHRGAGMLAGTWLDEQPILDGLVELRPGGLSFTMAVAAERAFRVARATAKDLWRRAR